MTTVTAWGGFHRAMAWRRGSLSSTCQGNYAVGPDYDGQIGHRYFDQGNGAPPHLKAMRGSLPLYGVAAGVRKVAQLPPHGASLNERCRNEIQGG